MQIQMDPLELSPSESGSDSFQFMQWCTDSYFDMCILVTLIVIEMNEQYYMHAINRLNWDCEFLGGA